MLAVFVITFVIRLSSMMRCIEEHVKSLVKISDVFQNLEGTIISHWC
jgi:hypothetical protein